MTNEIKQWHRKRIDILIVILYVLVISMVFHIVNSIRHRHFDETSIMARLTNPFQYLLILFFTIIFASPFTSYYRKVPKYLIIDPGNRKLHIKKRRNAKQLNYDLNRITYHTESTKWFSVIELYSEITNSRGIVMNKRFTSIVVPAFGFSWNKKTIREIIDTLEELEVPAEENPEKKSMWDHIYR